MKKTLVVFLVCMFSICAFSQTGKKMGDCVMMKDGKMMVMKDGKTMMMDKDMKMKNGTMVMTDGSVKMKDGKMTKMKEGEMMTMSGKMKMEKMSKKMEN